jgi:hypothetical protein
MGFGISFIFRCIFAYFLIKLLKIYPDIYHNFIKKVLKIYQNLKLTTLINSAYEDNNFSNWKI